MRIGNYEISFKSVQNKEDKGLRSKMRERTIQREKETIKKWRNALRKAENVINPNRQDLLRIYREITLDPHLHSVMMTRKQQVLEKGFMMVDEGGDMNDEETLTIKKKWFRDFIDHAFDSIFYGFSLIEFGDLIGETFTYVHEIDRFHVIPERKAVTLNGVVGSAEIHFDERPYNQTTLFVGNDDFGLLNKAAPIALWKKIGMNAYAEFTDIYGIPPVIGKTDTNDKESMDIMQKMLANFRSATYGVFDQEDTIEIPDISQANAGPHDTFVNLMNKELSKLILGQTMTTEDGSSYSQAKVHGEILATYERADLQYIKDVINLKLIPFLSQKGLVSETSSFEWNIGDNLSNEEIRKNYETLLPHYNIDPEEIEKDLGVTVEGPKASQGFGARIMNKAFTDYPKKAQDVARRALDYAKQTKKGTEKEKRLARRIIRGEGLGKRTLTEITTFKRFAGYKNQEWKESKASLAFALAGGEAMVEDYAPRKLAELRRTNRIESAIIEKVDGLYQGAHTEDS